MRNLYRSLVVDDIQARSFSLNFALLKLACLLSLQQFIARWFVYNSHICRLVHIVQLNSLSMLYRDARNFLACCCRESMLNVN